MKTCVVSSNHIVNPHPFIKKGVNIYTCSTCGCLMAEIDFVHGQYENKDYYTMVHHSKAEIEQEWGFRWRFILNQLVDKGNFSSLLDVGAGNGYFVNLASNEFGLSATGLEISSEQIEFANQVFGVNLVNEDILQHNRNYDVVTCFNVIEHVPDPQAFLASLVKRMNPEGVLVITTPNPGCIHARIKGLKNWGMVDPPHHINLFTLASLNEMFGAHNLEATQYTTLSAYIRFVRKFDTRSLLFRRTIFNILRIFGLGADHFCVLRKRN